MYDNCSHVLLYVVIVYTAFLILVVLIFTKRLRLYRRKMYRTSLLPQEYVDFISIPHFPKSFFDVHDGGSAHYEGSTDRLIRYIIRRQDLIGAGITTVLDEYQLIREYIELVGSVSEKEIDLICEVDQSINLKTTSIPAGVILLFVENAFETELDSIESFYVKLCVSKEGDCVSVVVGYSCKDTQQAIHNINMCSQRVWQAVESLNKTSKHPLLFTWSNEHGMMMKVSFVIPKDFCN